MMWFLLVSAFVCLVFFGIQVYTFISITEVAVAHPKQKDLPVVSILLAARNEEKLIIRSLESIEALNYPKDKIEVLIGNDASTDRTAELITQFIQDNNGYTLKNIHSTLGLARGKANVLAHLAKEAKGEIFLITDVDVRLPENWARTLVKPFDKEGVGIASGTTYCAKTNWFGTMQSMDWLHFMGYIKAFAHRGISCTSVGNNMAVRAEAYHQTGGYENMKFSITEDYRLFDEVTSRGWNYENLIGPHCLGEAWPIDSVYEMLHQRKRWLIGAQDLPKLWKFMIRLYGLFYPVLIGLFLAEPKLGLAIWLTKFVIQTAFITQLSRINKVTPYLLLEFISYEVYLWLNTALTAMFYILPVKNKWKGRTYSPKNVA